MSTVRIQIRRGLAADWTSVDPDLAPGELGLETDTGKMKVGAETATAWTNLPYINVTESGLGDSLDDYILAADRGAANGVASLDSTGNVPFSQLGNIIDGAPGVLDTLNEIAAAVNDDATFFTTVSNSIATKLPLAGGTMSGAIAMGNSKITGLATPTSNYDASTKKYVDDLQQQTVAGIFTHEGTTTNIHGVADMTALATFGYVDTAVSTHSQDSTNVHGIANTADLATIDYVDSEISTLDTAAQGYATSAGSTAATNLSNHNSDTTNVHGISDTAELATKSYADTAEADAITAAGTAADTKIATAVAALTKSSVGLGNVDNTSDADKPVSTATQTALDAKASLSGATFTGSVEIDQNLTVDGNLTVNGTTFSASSTSITIEDNLVQLAHQNAANTVDLGIVVGYNDGAAKHSGIVRDVSADKWKLFKGVTTEPATTVDFSEGSLDALQVGALEATTVTPSSGIVFSDGTQTKVGVPSITTFATEISSSATLASGEQDKFVPLSGAVTITLPSSGYSTGQSIDFYQATGTGAQFASTNSVVGTPGLKFRTTNSVVTAMKTSSGWLVFGDLSA